MLENFLGFCMEIFWVLHEQFGGEEVLFGSCAKSLGKYVGKIVQVCSIQ
jgi:hypothetical protein